MLVAQQKKNSKIINATDEGFIKEHLKHMMQNINDIRVLLNDNYTRDYIFEILKKTSGSKT